uniref:Uncharacterized protein n=1 Tax=Brassica oleracea var. oleracea TaxID=109376 RepID=A0A0D2ZY61_BRAOL
MRLSPAKFWLDYTHSFRISPNPGTKSVKEHSTKWPGFANPETVFVRKQCCNVKSKTTLGNDMERWSSSLKHIFRSSQSYYSPISALSSIKNVAKCDTWCQLQNPVNHRVFERKLRPKPSSRGHVFLGVTNHRPPIPSRISDGSWSP